MVTSHIVRFNDNQPTDQWMVSFHINNQGRKLCETDRTLDVRIMVELNPTTPSRVMNMCCLVDDWVSSCSPSIASTIQVRNLSIQLNSSFDILFTYTEMFVIMKIVLIRFLRLMLPWLKPVKPVNSSPRQRCCRFHNPAGTYLPNRITRSTSRGLAYWERLKRFCDSRLTRRDL